MTSFLEPHPAIDVPISLEAISLLVFAFASFCLLLFSGLQFLTLFHLEDDYLNVHDAANRLNRLFIPEFYLHSACCILFLLTGHWWFFLVTLGPTAIHLMKFMKNEHLFHSAEIIGILKDEKKKRLWKICFYLVLTAALTVRFAMSCRSVDSPFRS